MMAGTLDRSLCSRLILAGVLLGPLAAAAATSSCPVTAPNGKQYTGEPAGGNHGNDALITTLWSDGRIAFQAGGAGSMLPDGALSLKFPWWRLRAGPLTVEGRRLDAEAPPMRATILGGYGETGFQVTELIFPTPGCWEVTGRLGEASLTFVTLVEKIGAGPSAAIIDGRDDQTYGVLHFGSLQWLARNMNYASGDSWCFDDDPMQCELHGRLYTWQAALEACPEGWRVPTDLDWMDLEIAVGMPPLDAAGFRTRGTNEGDLLRSDGGSGFNAPIAGYRRPDGSYARHGERGAFWTATEVNDEDAWHRDIRSDVGSIYRSPVTKTYALSVRCVRE